MTIIEFSEHMEKEAGLQELGFLPVKKWKDREIMVYERKFYNRVDVLSISVYWYSQSKKENGIFLGYQDMPKGIYFNQFIDLFEKAKIEVLRPFWYNKENYNNDKILSTNHPKWKPPFNKYPSSSENLLNLDQSLNEKKAEEACKILRNIIEEQILPFYELYPNIQSVNDEIINNYETAKDLSGYISGQIGFKKMAIMGICKNAKYQEYIYEFEERLKKGVLQNREKYLTSLEFFYRLKTVLEKYDKEELQTG